METIHLENRIVRLEVRSDNHAEEIAELRKATSDLTTTLQAVEKNIQQIKYLATGALAVVVGQSMGIDKVIKLFIGG